MVKALRSDTFRSQYTKLGADVVGSTPEEFTAFVRRDIAQHKRVVKLSGAKLD